MNLSKSQEKIVNTTAKEVVVIAAAASGKTATLVARIQHLLDIGVDPTKIVMITFTNAAAEEIAERMARSFSILVSICNLLQMSFIRDFWSSVS